MDYLIGLLYLVGFLAIPVGIGLAIGMWSKKRAVGKYRELLAEDPGWQQVPADPELWQRIRLLRDFARSRGLRDYFHMTGEYRQQRFDVVQYRRPPGLGQRITTHGTAVILPRPVPGPEIRLAESNQWARLGQDLLIPLGHQEFDRTYLLTGTDAEFARAVIPPRLAESLLRDPRVTGRVIEFAPNHLIVFGGVAATTRTVYPMLDLLIDVHNAVPWQNLTRR